MSRNCQCFVILDKKSYNFNTNPKHIKNKTLTQKLLFGGSAGLIICLSLFIFYIFIFFPLIKNISEKHPIIQSLSLIPPTLTGHIFPMMSHFAIEGSPMNSAICPRTEALCVLWDAELTKNCKIPWTMEGTNGCCREKIMAPSGDCSNKIEIMGFAILSLLLFSVYFGIGILIAYSIHKIKQEKLKNK